MLNLSRAGTTSQFAEIMQAALVENGLASIGFYSFLQAYGYFISGQEIAKVYGADALDKMAASYATQVQAAPLSQQFDLPHGQVVALAYVPGPQSQPNLQRYLESCASIYGMLAQVEASTMQVSLLKERNQVYDNIYNLLEEAIIITDEHDRIVYVNKAFTGLTGYLPAESLGRAAYELLLPQHEWGNLYARMEERLKGKHEIYEAQLLNKQGQTWQACIKAWPQRNNSGQVIGTVGILTAIDQAAAKAPLLGPQLSQVAGAMHTAVALLTPLGQLLYANAAAQPLVQGLDLSGQVSSSWFRQLLAKDPEKPGHYPFEYSFSRYHYAGQVVPLGQNWLLEATNITRQAEVEKTAGARLQLLDQISHAARIGLLGFNRMGIITQATGQVLQHLLPAPQVQLPGLNVHELLSPWPKAVLAADAALQGMEKTIEIMAQNRRLQLHIQALNGLDADAQAIAIVNDITERDQASHELKAQRLLLNEILDALPLNIFLKDQQGRYLFTNKQISEELGIAAARLHGRTDAEVLPADLARLLTATDQQALKQGNARSELKIPTRRGNRFWQEEKRLIRITGIDHPLILGYHSDITERRKVEQELDNQKVFAQQILDASPNLIFVKDWDGHFVLINQAMAGFYGKTKEQLLAQNLAEDHENDPALSSYLEVDRQVITTMVPRQSEDVMIDGVGQKHFFIMTKVPLVRSDGTVNVLAMATDVTQEVNTRRELEEAKAMAERATKAKDQFLSNMSHEIRTPVNGIIGFVQLMLDTDISEAQRDYVSAIRTSADNLRVIVDDILDFSKIQEGRLTLENIGFFLEEETRTVASTFLPRALSKNLRLELRIDRRLHNVVVLGDPVRYAQVLGNLLSNAIKFTGQGKILTDLKCIYLDANSAHVMLRVEDTGVGIEPGKLDLVFERFSQADESITRRYGGTGLGLSIVKQLVSLMGGTITVESQPGKGTSFIIELSLRLGNESHLKQDTGYQPHGHEIEQMLGGKKVLLVEDNAINQMLALNLLKRWGMNTEVAENGLIALEKIQSHQPDLVLLDIQMPVMDGFETTQHIRNSLPQPLCQVPIIALTANAFTGDMAACLEAGMDDFISKPFNQAILLQKIIKVLNLHKQPLLAPREGSGGSQMGTLFITQNMTDLSYLKEFSGNDEAFIKEMIEIFIARCQDDLPQIRAAADEARWSDLKGLIHKMKPSVTFMGLHSIEQTVQECETQAGNPTNPEGIRQMVNVIIDTCQKATVELEERLVAQNFN